MSFLNFGSHADCNGFACGDDTSHAVNVDDVSGGRIRYFDGVDVCDNICDVHVVGTEQ